MNQPLRFQGARFDRIVWVLAVLAAGCESSGTPAAPNDASTTVDRPDPLDAGTDAGRRDVPIGFDSGPSLTSVRASITGDAGTSLDVQLALIWVTDIVTATSADDPAGFFVQGPGGAIFVAIDPTTLSPPPQRGDYLFFRATRGEAHASGRWITAITNYGRGGDGDPFYADPAPLDLSAASGLVSHLNDYEHRRVRVQGTIAGDFAGAGVGFEAAQITTAGVPVTTTNLVLRVPAAMRSSLNLHRGCTFTVNSPLWRNNAQAQVHVWTADQLTLGACPGDADGGTDAGTPTD